MKTKILFFLFFSTFSISLFAAPITIAIDPGHGGKDPGAISRNLGIYEKNVTLSIAKELKTLLDKDPNFRGVLKRIISFPFMRIHLNHLSAAVPQCGCYQTVELMMKWVNG